MRQVMQAVAQPLATFTRPNDTTAYADGDVVGDSTSAVSALRFPGAAGDGFGGVIRSAHLTSNAIPGTKLNADLWLFNAPPANTYGNDNDAFALNDVDRDKLVGIISLDGATAANVKVSTANYAVIAQGLAIPFKLQKTGSETALYGVLVARNAYTPAAQEAFTVKLGIEQA